MKESAKKYSVINLNLGALRELTPSVDDPLMVFLVVDVVPLSSSKEREELTVLAEILRSIQDCKRIYFPLAHKDQSHFLPVLGEELKIVQSKRDPSYRSHTNSFLEFVP